MTKPKEVRLTVDGKPMNPDRFTDWNEKTVVVTHKADKPAKRSISPNDTGETHKADPTKEALWLAKITPMPPEERKRQGGWHVSSMKKLSQPTKDSPKNSDSTSESNPASG